VELRAALLDERQLVGTTFGPSHIGAINLVSGNNHGAIASQPTPAIIDGTQVSNVEPTFDDCPQDPVNIHFDGPNIGDLLNAHGVTWGWFSGGFKATSRLPDGTAVCNETHTSKLGVTDTDYDSGNEPVQYYRSTANPHHLPPTSVGAIGRQDRANHQYDLDDFWAAAKAGNLPAVSFVRARGYQQGGGDDSDPLDEQLSGPLTGLFDFARRQPPARKLFLNPTTGEPVAGTAGGSSSASR
jgi:phospholipase C